MRQRTFLVDVDGVLANFAKAFLAHANKVTGLHRTVEDVLDWEMLKLYPADSWDEISAGVAQEGFCYGLEVLPGAREGIRTLRSLGTVLAVTSPWSSRSWCWERTSWLEDNFGFSSKDVLHVSGERKALVRGDMLIDDKASTVIDWKQANPYGVGVIWDATYNRNTPSPGVLRARSWQRVVAALSL